MRTLILGTALFICVGMQAGAGTSSPMGVTFGPKWKLLIGEWKAEHEPGGGSGACGFHFDLSEHVIVRTNHALLSASVAAHDDLMVIYPGPGEDKAKAVYFDNEGHVIEYIAEWTADGNTLTFMSKPAPGPQFRLIYKKLGAEMLSVSFEMAPPGQAGAFKPYASGKIRRTSK